VGIAARTVAGIAPMGLMTKTRVGARLANKKTITKSRVKGT